MFGRKSSKDRSRPSSFYQLGGGDSSSTISLLPPSLSSLDLSSHVQQEDVSFTAHAGAIMNLHFGANVQIGAGRAESRWSDSTEEQRFNFNLSVNRFFRIAQLLVPKFARKAIYWWFETQRRVPQNTYPRSLLTLGFGYPLWVPTPKDSDCSDVRKRGVQIGDVGILNKEGGFTFLFNVCERRGEDILWNSDSLDRGRVAKDVFFRHPVVLRNAAYIYREKDKTFYSHKPKGGILYLPSPVTRTEAHNVERFRQFALKHGRAWYEAASHHYGYNINGSLYLITGHDSTTSSMVATHYSMHTVGIKVESKAEKTIGEDFTVAWDEEAISGGAQKRFNPPVKGSNGQLLNNQCIFFRGIRIKMRSNHSILQHQAGCEPELETLVKSLSIQNMKKSDIDSFAKGGSHVPLRPRGGAPGTEAMHSARGSAKFPEEELFHPSDVINDFILDKLYPNTTIAATHDDEWTSLIREDDVEFMSKEGLVDRWCQAQHETGRNVGIEYQVGNEPHVYILPKVFNVRGNGAVRLTHRSVQALTSATGAYPYVINWSLVVDYAGQTIIVTQGAYRVDEENSSFASFKESDICWNVELTTSSGDAVVFQGECSVGSLLV